MSQVPVIRPRRWQQAVCGTLHAVKTWGRRRWGCGGVLVGAGGMLRAVMYNRWLMVVAGRRTMVNYSGKVACRRSRRHY